jgi:hypothetical protein
MPIDPKDLRLLLDAELDKLPDKYLSIARQMLLEIQMQLLLENLDAAADAARGFSLLMPGRLAKAIAEHRAAHPCHR